MTKKRIRQKLSIYLDKHDFDIPTLDDMVEFAQEVAAETKKELLKEIQKKSRFNLVDLLEDTEKIEELENRLNEMQKKCKKCEGTGFIPLGEGIKGIKKCPFCDGTGIIEKENDRRNKNALGL